MKRLSLAILLILTLSSLVSAQHKTFNVVDYGAVPDGRAVNTAAIQKAVNTCSAAGGETVYVPAGILLRAPCI